MLWFWIAFIVVLIAVEAATVQIVSIWFAVGAVGGLIAYACSAPIWAQILVFVAVSSITLAATRPLVKRFSSAHIQPTNADRNIGKTAIVVEAIDNEHGTGAVTIGGLEWTARAADGEKIQKDETVTVQSIEGAKLIVKTK